MQTHSVTLKHKSDQSERASHMNSYLRKNLQVEGTASAKTLRQGRKAPPGTVGTFFICGHGSPLFSYIKRTVL